MTIKIIMPILLYLYPTICLTQAESNALRYGKHSMVVTNNSLASQTAARILKQGGTAVDAAIAAAFVLGLTEPQSSGIGGGGYALTFNRAKNRLIAYNGRERAAQSVHPKLFLKQNNKELAFKKAILSPKSIGVPGEIALLFAMHQQEGKLPWKRLIKPAQKLAEQGFPLNPRLHNSLEVEKEALVKDPIVKGIFYKPNNEVKSIGSLIKNPDYASSLAQIANNPHSFYTGILASHIKDKINESAGKKIFSLADLKSYNPSIAQALCTSYRSYSLCTTADESGGVALLEFMKIFEKKYTGKQATDKEWIYQFLETSKLVYADRDKYSADPAFVPAFHSQLIHQSYINQQARRIVSKALKTPVKAGKLSAHSLSYGMPDPEDKSHGTTSLAIVDKEGNAVSMTVTVEQAFGSHIFVDGFFLNNELSDFSFAPADALGKSIANKAQAGKRPRSAIAPVMVFNANKELIALSGSPGSGSIICYVAKNLIYLLDFNKNVQETVESGNLCANNAKTLIEANSSLIPYIPDLKHRGENIETLEMISGVATIFGSKTKGWFAAPDPRRDGLAIGN